MNERQQRFVDAYVGPAKGVAAEAVRLAGYKASTNDSAASMGERLLRNVEVSQAILVARTAIREEVRRATIMDLVEQEELLTRIARGEEFDVKAERQDGETHRVVDVVPIEPRLKALDQLAKRRGAYAADKAAGKSADAATVAAAVWSDIAKRKRIE